MSSKIARGSFIILIGTFIFRIGGYIYRFIMANLLGPAGYGILGLTLPLQGMLITTANGGLPPAIAKYVAEYSAQKQDLMVKQIIKTSMKVMIVLGIVFSILIFFLAEPLAIGLFHKPEAVLPFQLIALITPFSVIVGAFRGVFQGFYQMTNILITKVFEQFFMIIFAVILVLAGMYVAGAVAGTAIGFMAAAVAGAVIFRRQVWSKLSKSRNVLSRAERKITLGEELKLVRMLLIFSIPVVITGLAEIALYDIGTFVIGAYMASEYVGYYNAASPIARLPLIISMSVATAVLPATAEAFGLRDHGLLKKYVLQSYRYVAILVVPLCIITIVFSNPIISILFGPAYASGSEALKILAVGMLFFTIYTVSSSVAQGLGKPYLPMIALIIGTLFDLILSIILVPMYGINGAAIATSIAAFIIMAILAWKTLQIVNVKLPYGDFVRIAIASFLMGIFLMFFPQIYGLPGTYGNFVLSRVWAFLYIMIAILMGGLIYTFILTLIGGLKKNDLGILYKFQDRLGPFSGLFAKLVELLERFAR
jgi:stage V sporulation protein B